MAKSKSVDLNNEVDKKDSNKKFWEGYPYGVYTSDNLVEKHIWFDRQFKRMIGKYYSFKLKFSSGEVETYLINIKNYNENPYAKRDIKDLPMILTDMDGVLIHINEVVDKKKYMVSENTNIIRKPYYEIKTHWEFLDLENIFIDNMIGDMKQISKYEFIIKLSKAKESIKN